ncbi:hypothetical protein D3C75_1101790 [compost metagenome]
MTMFWKPFALPIVQWHFKGLIVNGQNKLERVRTGLQDQPKSRQSGGLFKLVLFCKV